MTTRPLVALALAALVPVLAARAETPPAPAERAPSAPAGGPHEDAVLATLAFALASAPGAGQLPLGVEGPGANGAAAVEVALEVTVKEVVFDARPTVRVLVAEGARGATWRVERLNLPAQLQAGVAYRDVGVRVYLVATPDALETLLADARRAAGTLRIVPQEAAP